MELIAQSPIRNNHKLAFFVISMNHEKFIPDLINSLAQQTFKDFSVYWLDNISSDNTKEVAIAGLRENEIEFQFYSNPKSAPASRNLNFLISKLGNEEFICTSSADDYIHPENIAQKINFLKEHKEIPLVYSNGYYLYNDTKETVEVNKEISLKGGKIYNELIKRNFVFLMGVVYRTAIFKTIGGFDENNRIEDWDIALRISKEYEIGYIDKPLFYYRQHSKNMSLNYDSVYIEDCFKVINKHKKTNPNYYSGIDNFMGHYIICLRKEKNFISALFKVINKSGIRIKTLYHIKILIARYMRF